MIKTAIFIGLLACVTETKPKQKKMVDKVQKTLHCAVDEAEVLKELTLQCKNMLAKEIKRFKKEKCKGQKLKIESKLYRADRIFPQIRF